MLQGRFSASPIQTDMKHGSVRGYMCRSIGIAQDRKGGDCVLPATDTDEVAAAQ